MRFSFRSLLLSSTLAAGLLAAPLAASQSGPADADKAGEAKADQPAAPAAADPPAAAEEGAGASQDPPATGDDPPQSRADLRTFAGRCIRAPTRPNPQIAPILATLIPQLVGAGVDALTGALAAAGQDRPLSQSTVIALENAVECVQVARDVTILSDTDADPLRTAVGRAPFLVEFFLRRSADGSALLITPTVLNYSRTLDRRETSRQRTLYATLTFSEPGGERSSTVTVPLGGYTTRIAPYLLDAVGPRRNKDGFSSLGASNSIWIPNPFRAATLPPAPGEKNGQEDGQTQASTPTPTQPAPARTAGGANAPGAFGQAGQPHQTPVNPPAPAAPGAGKPQAPAPFPEPAGTAVMPLSITVVITEIRPGSALARALAGVLRGSRTGIVDALDPTKREEARQAERTANAQLTTDLHSAERKYDDAFHAYCAAPRAERISKVSDLHEAQVQYLAALQAVHQIPPADLQEPINARIGLTPAQDNALCTDFPEYQPLPITG